MSNYNTQLQSNNADLQIVLQTLQTKAAGGEQATPVISVSSNGLITATAGTKSATKQLAFQAAKTITPGTASQIAVSSGYYTGGNITVAGDANLISGNIKSGVSIFGVSGTLVEGGGSSGDGYDEADGLITGTMTSYTNARVTSMRQGAFAYVSNLQSVNFPNVKNIGSSAFQNCSKLTTASFPACTSIGDYAFSNCKSLTTASFPVCTSIGSNAFYFCSKLTTISFPKCTNIGSKAFQNCYSLTTISFPKCTNIGINAFCYCYSLTTASFPICTNISGYAFSYCSGLTTASFTICTNIGSYAFYCCSKLTTISFPKCTNIGSYAFYNCKSLTTASFPKCTNIGSNAFSGCSTLSNFILAGSSIPTLDNSNAFNNTLMSTTGYFYVPSSLIANYKAATNWTYFSSRFSAI
jgi:hypothetical protein